MGPQRDRAAPCLFAAPVMASVAIIPTQLAVDAAWDRYAALCRRLQGNIGLLTDRTFQQEMLIAENEWKEAFSKWLKSQ